MRRVRFLHWNADEAAATLASLRKARFQVEYAEAVDAVMMRQWRADPPQAFIIDLSRMPSRGREIAIALRQSPKTRHVPIIFCDGALEKVKLIRDVLPDATYCVSADLIKTLRNVKPLHEPAKPLDMMNRYSSRTTAQKLGIREQSSIAAMNPPRNLQSMLGELPQGAEFCEEAGAVTLCFVHSVDELRADISRVRSLAAATKLWILWRKKSAPGHDGVTEPLVRETGLELGLVDYKICSVDNTWSAILFAKKR